MNRETSGKHCCCCGHDAKNTSVASDSRDCGNDYDLSDEYRAVEKETGGNRENGEMSAPSCCSMSCCSVRESSEGKKEPQNALEKMIAVFGTVRGQLVLAAISGTCVIISFTGLWRSVFPWDPAWGAIVFSGIPLFWGAAVALWNRRVTAEVLVSTAILATIVTNEIFAGGEVAFIMMLGRLLENWTVKRARAGIEKLIRLTPRTARKLESGTEEDASETGNGSGSEIGSGNTTEKLINAAEVRSDDILRVLPGESIPVDGRILGGDTTIDQQLLTGEPLPVDKGAGDEVFAGTINRFGAFTMRATKVGEDSSLARMIRLVREAEMRKAPMERITDRWASILVPVAIVTAILVGLYTGEILRAVTILVVFCPCSLVLATPTAIVAAIGNAARYGILIRSGAVLEQLGKITSLAFDKTGTLTEGKPQTQAVKSLHPSWNDESLLALAATVEQYSDHPISKCITETARSRNVTLEENCVESRVVPGRGIFGKIDRPQKNGAASTVLLGNEVMLRENGVVPANEAGTLAETYVREGATLVWIVFDGELCGFIAISDSLRSEAAEMVRELQSEKIDVLLLTGDHAPAAQSIAKKVGIRDVRSGLLPEDKQRIIAEKVARGEVTAMLGDGINDAPALKSANVGIAMGKVGSDIAVEAADIALVGDEISRVPFLVRLSKKTVKTIIGNICLSMGINFVAVALAATGRIDPAIGALIHNAGSLLVVFNASLLLGLRWEKK